MTMTEALTYFALGASGSFVASAMSALGRSHGRAYRAWVEKRASAPSVAVGDSELPFGEIVAADRFAITASGEILMAIERDASGRWVAAGVTRGAASHPLPPEADPQPVPPPE